MSAPQNSELENARRAVAVLQAQRNQALDAHANAEVQAQHLNVQLQLANSEIARLNRGDRGKPTRKRSPR